MREKEDQIKKFKENVVGYHFAECEVEKITDSILKYLKEKYPYKNTTYEWQEKDLDKITRFVITGKFLKEDINRFLTD